MKLDNIPLWASTVEIHTIRVSKTVKSTVTQYYWQNRLCHPHGKQIIFLIYKTYCTYCTVIILKKVNYLLTIKSKFKKLSWQILNSFMNQFMHEYFRYWPLLHWIYISNSNTWPVEYNIYFDKVWVYIFIPILCGKILVYVQCIIFANYTSFIYDCRLTEQLFQQHLPNHYHCLLRTAQWVVGQLKQ